MSRWAEYNADTLCVNVYANEDAEKPKTSIYTQEVEKELDVRGYALAELKRLMEYEPLEYAELVCEDSLGEYLRETCEEAIAQCLTLKEQLQAYYPDKDEAQIDLLVEEYTRARD